MARRILRKISLEFGIDIKELEEEIAEILSLKGETLIISSKIFEKVSPALKEGTKDIARKRIVFLTSNILSSLKEKIREIENELTSKGFQRGTPIWQNEKTKKLKNWALKLEI